MLRRDRSTRVVAQKPRDRATVAKAAKAAAKRYRRAVASGESAALAFVIARQSMEAPCTGERPRPDNAA